MRVIVLSVVILVVLVIAGVGLFNKGDTPPPDNANTNGKVEGAALDNPFADEAIKDKNVALPTLPASAPANSNSTPTVQPGSQAGQAVVTAQNAQAGATSSEQGSAAAKDGFRSNDDTGKVTHAATMAVVGEDNNNATAVPPSSGSQPVPSDDRSSSASSDKTPKLGLAMLELEKEKKRNLIAVIVNENNPQNLSTSEIKAMYLDRLTHWNNGSKILLYNLPLGDQYREKFSKTILEMTALEADKAESQRREAHTNINPIEVKASNIIVSYVEQHNNAVAYVPLSQVRDKSKVRVIMTIP